MNRNPNFSIFSFLFLLTLFPVRYAYDDFNWQTIEAGALKVHWYEGDESFGQAALESAQEGLEAIGHLVPVDLQQPIDIFIYANAEDLQGELESGKSDWVAGHADPALGIVRVLVELGPQQGIAMEQRIPHELMHVMLFRHLGTGYNNIPAWLREGIAAYIELYPNVDYDRVLNDAVTNNRLIPLNDLCLSFPADTGQAFLAYAEARSFIEFLYKMYGSDGILNLATVYANGVDCVHGSERALGVSLPHLESLWRSSALGQNTFVSILRNILPYLVLLGLVLLIPLISIVRTLRKRNS